jgi:1-pyrroline-5-carboxylate dehydrogenase
MYGEVCRKAAELLAQDDIVSHFVKLIQRLVPKSVPQALGEVKVARAFLANFSGDNVRFLAEATAHPGDHDGQHPTSYRWPLGSVAVISPFNFPLEIPGLQMMSALFMGNKVIVKPNSKTTAIMEEFIRLLHYCGMPLTDVDLCHVAGDNFEKLYAMCPIRMTQFTGSSDIAEKLAVLTHGRVRLEDAGFDWKLYGPDAHTMNIDYLAWQSDQDAYALSGQKCSAQSFMIVHKNLAKTDFYKKLAEQAAKRNLADLSIGPVLSVKNAEMQAHMEFCSKLEGGKVLFGGKPLTGHTIPPCYGAWEPSAYLVPLKHFFDPKLFPKLINEIFGPVQVVTEYDDSEIDQVLDLLERIPLHLTAAIVSNDAVFRHKAISLTVNGTTYAGYKARTTGAPQNHWFGPCGDIRAAGIGTPEAIKLVWSVHREVIFDDQPEPSTWKLPKPT